MNIYDRQLEIEREAIALGSDRYMERLEAGELTDIPAGQLLMKNAITPLRQAIEVYLKNTKAGLRTKDTLAFFSLFKTQELAYFTLRQVIDGLSDQTTIQMICYKIVSDLTDHLEYNKYKEEAPGHHHVVTGNLSVVATAAHKRKVIMRAKRMVGLKDTLFTPNQRVIYGKTLINLCMESTGLCQVGKKRKEGNGAKGYKYDAVLEPTEKIAAWIVDKHEKHSIMSPVHMPMICPPKDWTTPFDGGYLSNIATMRQTMVRAKDGGSLLELAEHDMPEVYKCINNLQRTPWRINQYIMNVVEELWANGIEIGKEGKSLPSAFLKPIPAKPWASDEEYKELEATDKEVITNWKREASLVHEFNALSKSRRVAANAKIKLARKFKDEEALYYIWTMDWRGRVYPHCVTVSCQSDDLGASLVEFGNGHPLGKTGAYALACSVAGYFGVDKVSLDDRVQWVKDHTQQILDVAANPLDNLWWTDADKPFHFLSMCNEWSGYIREGNDYVTHCRCQLDGSNNGNQHYAAMRRCMSGASVNLLPVDKPADLYSEVADVVREIVVKEAITGNHIAQWWQDKVTRSTVKRGVMTFCYGVSQQGVISQIHNELKKAGTKFESNDSLMETLTEKLDAYIAAKFLGGILWKVLATETKASFETMEWIKKNVKATMKEAHPLRWTTPIGFKVIQKYIQKESIRVNTFWGDVRIQLTMKQDKPNKPIDARKMVAAIAPCYIHSHDASHLMSTANSCHDQGVTDFSPIHDSFGVSPCFVEILSPTIREEFIKMYADGQALKKFRTEILEGLPDTYELSVAPAPSMGPLDLNMVRESLYFFA